MASHRNAPQAPPPGAPARGMLELLERIPRPLALGLSIALILTIAAVNYSTALDLRFSFFYLLPVALSSWRLGRAAGLAFSLGSAASWLVEHLFETRFDPAGRVMTLPNALLLLGFFVLVTLLLTALRHALDREREAARVDALTGVANRRAFLEVANSEIERVSRYGGRFTVAFLDLDDFKAVNDREGHAAGDRVLQRFATAVRGGLRTNDLVARLGGDEFVVLLPETGAAEAGPVLEKLRVRIGEAQDAGDAVTVSTGCVTFETPPAGVDEMLRLVDSTMYSAKSAGRGGVARRVFDGSGRAPEAPPSRRSG